MKIIAWSMLYKIKVRNNTKISKEIIIENQLLTDNMKK